MKPIYKPTGKAKEYGDYAINIYTGCPHRCYYCFAPNVLRRDKEEFHSHVEPRKDIVSEVAKQLEREKITGKLIHLCFTCDPYPTGYDTTATREIIRSLKQSGNNVQILTKGDGSRDFDLLDGGDWYGVTISCDTPFSTVAEPSAIDPTQRLNAIETAKTMGIKTWVSFEPVLNTYDILCYLDDCFDMFDKVKIGKLNYYPSDIHWPSFGEAAEKICKRRGLDYYIKDSLRAEMEVDNG